MDKLFEFLTSKIGYTIAVIVGFLFPGMLFIFVWNREIYFEIALIRLIILALCIAFVVYVWNFFVFAIICFVQDKVGDREADASYMIGIPLFLTSSEIYVALLHKLEHSDFTIIQFVDIITKLGTLFIIVGVVPSALKLAWKKIRRKK